MARLIRGASFSNSTASLSQAASANSTCASSTFFCRRRFLQKLARQRGGDTVRGMPKPPMTLADLNALDEAFREKHASEAALLKAFRERKPKEEIDSAIRKFNETKQHYHSLVAKFFEDYPG
jgi:hypothetical protein